MKYATSNYLLISSYFMGFEVLMTFGVFRISKYILLFASADKVLS